MEIDQVVFNDRRLVIELDEANGYTTAIRYPEDEFGMNWILEDSDWGRVEGFDNYRVEMLANGADIYSESKDKKLSLKIEKRIADGVYTESYRITNNDLSEVIFTKDELGIHFPYNCTFENKKNLHESSCVTSLWCGGDIAWMCTAKPSGFVPYLVCNLTEGSISDYSISYDVSRVKVGASYRGDIVLIPGEQVLAPGKSAVVSFAFRFTDTKPDTGALDKYNRLRVWADRYSAFAGEQIGCRLDSLDEWESLEITCDGRSVDYVKSGNTARWTLCFDTIGERDIRVAVDGKKTWMRINILAPLDEILIKRAEFICEKQQCTDESSCLDGAYLIYDRATGATYYSESFRDNNASRERISMGVVVAQALQKKYSDKMFESLKRHRRFVERELLDTDTGRVYDEVGKNPRFTRAYNYPWMSVYYLEWYLLTGEACCLEISAKIMIAYYELANGGRQESPCMRLFEICSLLEKEKLTELLGKLKALIFAHADRVIANGSRCFSEEVSCTQFMFNGKINMLTQAYLISSDKKYLELVPEYIKRSNAFFGNQPDFHINKLAVRYWDLYWFGKMKTYGDTQPQWLTCLSAETYDFMYKTGFGEEYSIYSRDVLLNNLCVYSEDGFASAGYLVPYKVVQYASDETRINDYMKPGVAFGNRYDDFANDQDWSLYYAIKLLG